MVKCLLTLGLMVTAFVGGASDVIAGEQHLQLERLEDSLEIRVDDIVVASYVFQDPLVSRPYFAQVKTLSGLQVTRNHPPDPNEDATDHAGLHTGIWHSFGDLNGHDYWRLKAKTEHIRFVEESSVKGSIGTWAVENRYLTTDGNAIVCTEICRYRIQLIPQGYFLKINAEFIPGTAVLVFGDQEEMGFGVRMASHIAVDRKKGGRILDDSGRRNGSEVWGKTARWCDYAGVNNGRWSGITLMSSPRNFGPSWSHARDYGFLTVNPFGRKAFTGGEVSRVEIQPGSSLGLSFAAVIHESATEADYEPESVWQIFIEQ